VVDDEWVIKCDNEYLKYTPTQRPTHESTEDDGDDIPNDAVSFLRKVIASRSADLQPLP
jgi:hypothetical protein